MDNLDHIFKSDNVVSDEFLLRAYQKTIGIHQSLCEIDSVPCRIVDVPGSRVYRSEWNYCYESVHTVVFVVSLAGYCQSLPPGDQDPSAVSDNSAQPLPY